MPFICPQCLRADSLHTKAAIELRSDNRSDEISMQLVSCLACDFTGLIVYEESRRGALDSENYDLQGWHVDPKTYRDLMDQMNGCVVSSNSRCECETHRRFGQQDQQGRWVGPPLPPNSQAFAVQMNPRS
jgi:hypothetical protein